VFLLSTSYDFIVKSELEIEITETRTPRSHELVPRPPLCTLITEPIYSVVLDKKYGKYRRKSSSEIGNKARYSSMHIKIVSACQVFETGYGARYIFHQCNSRCHAIKFFSSRWTRGSEVARLSRTSSVHGARHFPRHKESDYTHLYRGRET